MAIWPAHDEDRRVAALPLEFMGGIIGGDKTRPCRLVGHGVAGRKQAFCACSQNSAQLRQVG